MQLMRLMQSQRDGSAFGSAERWSASGRSGTLTRGAPRDSIQAQQLVAAAMTSARSSRAVRTPLLNPQFPRP